VSQDGAAGPGPLLAQHAHEGSVLGSMREVAANQQHLSEPPLMYGEGRTKRDEPIFRASVTETEWIAWTW